MRTASYTAPLFTGGMPDRTPRQMRMLAYVLAGVFVAVNLVLYTYDFYWLTALPAVIAVGWLTFFRPYAAMLLVAFSTPLSMHVDIDALGASVNLPTEPLMLALLGLLLVHIMLRHPVERDLLLHPITIAIGINLLWILITALASSMPVVSLKFFLARLWFVGVFYFMGVSLFSRFSRLKNFVWLFCLSLIGVIAYTWVRHAGAGWEQDYANYAAIPFFKNHGVYAAVISLFLPLLVIFGLKRRVYKYGLWPAAISLFVAGIFFLAIVLSFTRAAWIGLAGAAGLFALMMLRIRFRTLLAALVTVIVLFAAFQTVIFMRLERNKTVSDDDLEAHLSSVTNIRNDASNVERLNRWSSAFRMFKERPVFGWGPGTYMFQYGAFQLSSEMTIISVRGGTQGNAHSEYIGPLAESGVLGSLTFIAILLVTIATGMRLYYRGATPRIRYTAMAVVLGLTTYYIHGLINNYLDLDKASVPFWAMIAILTALDLEHRKIGKRQIEEANRG